MARLMIDLPEDLDVKMRNRAAEAGCIDPQEYVRALITADACDSESPALGIPSNLTFNSKVELEPMLVEGLVSGHGEEITPANWAQLRQRLSERHARPEQPLTSPQTSGTTS